MDSLLLKWFQTAIFHQLCFNLSITQISSTIFDYPNLARFYFATFSSIYSCLQIRTKRNNNNKKVHFFSEQNFSKKTEQSREVNLQFLRFSIPTLSAGLKSGCAPTVWYQGKEENKKARKILGLWAGFVLLPRFRGMQPNYNHKKKNRTKKTLRGKKHMGRHTQNLKSQQWLSGLCVSVLIYAAVNLLRIWSRKCLLHSSGKRFSDTLKILLCPNH